MIHARAMLLLDRCLYVCSRYKSSCLTNGSVKQAAGGLNYTKLTAPHCTALLYTTLHCNTRYWTAQHICILFLLSPTVVHCYSTVVCCTALHSTSISKNPTEKSFTRLGNTFKQQTRRKEILKNVLNISHINSFFCKSALHYVILHLVWGEK